MASLRPRPQVMRLTDTAAEHIKAILARAEEPAAGVRVGVKNGGCAGMSYTMEYAASTNPLDEVIEDKGVRLLIDPKAVLFLLGTEMDYKVDKLSAGFVFNNPNQTSACGCGESVALTPATEAADWSGRGVGGRRVDADFIRELFAQFRPVEVRRMFGGAGLFVDGAMIGLEFSGVIYLKTSETTLSEFQREGSIPFVYPLAKSPRPRRRAPSTFWRLPERLYDDPDELARWAADALTAAQRKSKTKAKPARLPRARKTAGKSARKSARSKAKSRR